MLALRVGRQEEKIPRPPSDEGLKIAAVTVLEETSSFHEAKREAHH